MPGFSPPAIHRCGELPICRVWGQTLSRGPALWRRAWGGMREGGLAFVTSKGNDGGDRRLPGGREGFFYCPRPGPQPWAAPDPLYSCLRCDAKCERGGGSPPAPKGREPPPAPCIALLVSGRATSRSTCRPALVWLPRAVMSRPCRPESSKPELSKSGCC